MALNIERATEGYDSSNLGTLKDEIKTSCIDPAVSQLKVELETLKTAIDEIWVGDSANRFKDKMEKHVESAQRQMKEKRNEIDSFLEGVIGQLRSVDENISF